MSDEWLFLDRAQRCPARSGGPPLAVWVAGRPDGLVGYATQLLEITDPDVLATSGRTHHPIVVRTGVDTDVVPGHVLR